MEVVFQVIAVSGSGSGLNRGLSNTGVGVGDPHVRVSGPVFGIIIGCVISVCPESLVRLKLWTPRTPGWWVVRHSSLDCWDRTESLAFHSWVCDSFPTTN